MSSPPSSTSSIQPSQLIASTMASQVPVSTLRQCLIDTTQPVQKRTHAAFYLRTNGGLEAGKSHQEGFDGQH